MLLEQIMNVSDKPKYDWEEYYRWFLSELTGEEGADIQFWICKHCLTINMTSPTARYAKCRDCNLIYMGHHVRPVKK